MTTLLVASLLLGPFQGAPLELASCETVRRYRAPEARQAVAVDREHFYAITNRRIGKYRKSDGERVAEYQDPADGAIYHMNAGVVIGDRLYCANSNFPDIPMTGSIEIFDTRDLRHVGSRSFGIDIGSLLWVLKRDQDWWACFGHYNERGGEPGKTNERTMLVKFDDQFRKLEGFVFPKAVIDRWDGMTNSGAIWLPNGILVGTGHHAPELHLYRLPTSGSTLRLVGIVPMECEGQGIAYEEETGHIWGIQRRTGEVLVMKLPSLDGR